MVEQRDHAYISTHRPRIGISDNKGSRLMTDYLLPFQPSLAQATNTRLDSACKHIQQCRVSTDDMLRFVREDAEELQRNKYRYCIHKDELVVGVGRPWCVS